MKNNSSAFDGLLSLIPAKYYYDDDTQNQWKAKKQSKEEAKEAKRAKLDPTQSEESEQSASAAEIQKRRAKNAKPVVIPGSKIIPAKQVESEEEESDGEDDETSESEEQEPVKKQNGLKKAQEIQKENKSKGKKANEDEDEEEESINIIFDDDGNEVNLQDKQTKSKPQPNGVKKSPELSEEDKKRKEENLKALREKLASKIGALKEKRKAPGSKAAGAPSSREAILEERRKKAELKAAQKAERKKRKLEELEEEEEEDDNSDEEEESDEEDDGMSADNVLYQNIRFNEDERTTSDLQKLRKAAKKKGPAKGDLKAHLKIVEAKKQKLEELDDSKKKELKEKEKWNNVLARAEGEKLRNDEALLKKAIKRKEAQKRKSEFEWRERKETVANSISAKQKRREENLQIRKDNKGVKRKNQVKQKRKFKGAIVPKRAGFEGRRSRK